MKIDLKNCDNLDGKVNGSSYKQLLIISKIKTIKLYYL